MLRRVFCDTSAFSEEVAQYQDPVLKRCLPDLVAASANENGTVRSTQGFVFPPYLVIERGMPLTDWMMQRRGAMEVCHTLRLRVVSQHYAHKCKLSRNTRAECQSCKTLEVSAECAHSAGASYS